MVLSRGSRLFVGFVFSVLGASFIATTAVMIYEFYETQWFSLATFYSHLFVFFPTFGIVALAAFYVPACVLTDMYWKHVKFGRARFLIGFAVVAIISFVVTQALLEGEERTIWEVTPQTLQADKGDPAECNLSSSCQRLPVLQALSEVRQVSQSRIGLEPFGRNCRPDKLVELGEEMTAKRWCFVTRTKEDAATCCQAQERFGRFMTESYQPEQNRSLTGKVHNQLLVLKTFFLLVLLVVGMLLAARRDGVDRYYSVIGHKIESGVLIGAAIMLFWPIMNHAFLQSAAVLYGTHGDSLFRFLGPGFSFLFGAWGLLLLLFFYRRYDKSIETVGRIAGLMASAVAVLQYDNIIDYSVFVAGSGASVLTIGVLMLVGLVALAQLATRIWSRDGSGIGEEKLVEPEAAAARTSGSDSMTTTGVTSLDKG